MSCQLLLAFLLMVPQGPNSIRGHVVTPSSISPGRIEVILEKSTAFLSRNFSDSEGFFHFENLPDGDYAVVVRLEGYEEIRETPNFDRTNSANINVMLTPKGAKPETVQILYSKYPRKVVDDFEKALDDGRKGDTARAVERLETVVKAAADFPQAHNALGAQYQKSQRFAEAEKEYNRAVQLDASYAEPLVNIGSLYIQVAAQAQAKRDNQSFGAALDGAVRALNQAIHLQPNSAMAYYFLGTTYYTGGVFPKAEENLRHALALEKEMGQAELALANVYMKQQKWKQALEYLDAYLKENPKASDRDQIQQTRAKVAAQK